MLWAIFALMTGATAFVALWPLSRRAPAAGGADALGFQRAQLDEIDRDVARGQLPQGEAAAARAEAARRLLAAADALPAPPADPARLRLDRRVAAALILILVPAAAFTLYARLGSPALEDQPLLARADDPANPNFLEVATAKIETHLAAEPGDGRGWRMIGPLYMRQERYGDAVRAFAKALGLDGEDANLRADYGEALVTAAKGIVTPEAKAAFEQAHAENSSIAKPRVYLGLAAEQGGDKAKAIALYRSVVDDDLPLKEIWTDAMRQRLAILGGDASPPRAPAAEAGNAPPADAAAAIAGMDAPAQQTAIRGMVEGLAARLAANGDDQAGWLRLIRAWHVLGDDSRARDALAEARKALAGHAEAGPALDALAKDIGVGG